MHRKVVFITTNVTINTDNNILSRSYQNCRLQYFCAGASHLAFSFFFPSLPSLFCHFTPKKKKKNSYDGLLPMGSCAEVKSPKM